jgi:hypothetical protein
MSAGCALIVSLLYGERTEGKRKRGHPCLRLTDVCKRDMALAHINIDTWEETAVDRIAWRKAVKNSTNLAEATIRIKCAEKIAMRKAKCKWQVDYAIVPEDGRMPYYLMT